VIGRNALRLAMTVLLGMTAVIVSAASPAQAAPSCTHTMEAWYDKREVVFIEDITCNASMDEVVVKLSITSPSAARKLDLDVLLRPGLPECHLHTQPVRKAQLLRSGSRCLPADQQGPLQLPARHQKVPGRVTVPREELCAFVER
jgi:hypothetical protein